MKIIRSRAARLAIAIGLLAPAFAATHAHAAAPTVDATPLTPSTVFAAWDADKDKTLSPDEFSAGWARMERVATMRQLKAQFERNDGNRSGAIEAAEYATLDLVGKAGAAAPPLARFDNDRNGGLDFKEYVAMVTALVRKDSSTPAR